MLKLDHPNILKLQAVCETKQSFNLVMERGKYSLYKFIQSTPNNPPDWPTRYKMALQIAEGMYHAHLKNVLHRDLKSPNILILIDDRIVISDFGCAKLIPESLLKTLYFSVHSIFGTPRWLAPEVTRIDKPQYSTRSDVFSYGIILYELLVWDIPWKDDYPTTAMMRIPKGERPPIPDDINIPYPFQHLMEKCWSEDPEDRPHFYSIVEQLKSILKNYTQDSFNPTNGLTEEHNSYDLGVYFFTEKDERQALKFFQEGVNHKHADSMYFVGRIYECKKDKKVAREWYENAAALGSCRAERALKRMKRAAKAKAYGFFLYPLAPKEDRSHAT